MMPLKTKWEILKNYESRGMLNLDAALKTLNTDIETAKHIIAKKDTMYYINLLVFAHVEGPTIEKDLIDTNSKYTPAEIITRRYYKTILETDFDMEVMSENARQGLFYTTGKYLKEREKYERTV